jgi:YD repeat-containing protein
VKRTLPLGQFETYSYNTVGNLQSKTDFNGKTSTYDYDNANRLVSKTPDASYNAQPVTFTYNALGQRLTMVDASGTTTYTYDGSNRLRTKATPQGTLTCSYDAASDLTSLSSSNTNGVSTSYSYDALNRMSTVTANSDYGPIGNIVTNYTYDALGNLATVLYPNTVQHTYTYNTLNRLTNLAVAKTTPGRRRPATPIHWVFDTLLSRAYAP